MVNRRWPLNRRRPRRAGPVRAGALLALLLSGAAHAQLAPGYGELAFEPPAPGSYRLPPLGEAADGEVLTSDGEPVRLHALFGEKLTLLSFIYTSCSDVNGCPLAAHVLAGTLRAIRRDPALRARSAPPLALAVVSLSFDPVHDTPEALRRYSHWFRREHPQWRFATTASHGELQPLLDAYGQNRIVERDSGGAVFAHTLRVFLIDERRRIRNIYSVDYLHPDLILNDIRTLLDETAADDSPPTDGVSVRGGAGGRRVTGEPAPLLPERVPLGLPPLPVPDDNPLTEARVALGQRLFFDRRLSLNNTLSCAMCHIPAQGFANNEMATAVGFEGRTVRRNAPTVLNIGYQRFLFHDGRESALEQQIWQPLLAANEMANPSIGVVLDKIRAIPDYAGLFQAAFGRGPGMETVGQALAGYQRTLLLANSPFDRYYFGGETDALSADGRAGFALFTGRAGCAACHRIDRQRGYALFSDDRFHDTGIGWYRTMRPEPPTHRVRLAPGVFADVASEIIASASEPPPSDLGRYEITQDPNDRWRYRTPSLRNVALTAPYMHDGSLRSLDDVVAYYNAGGHPHPQLDPRIRPLGLNADERRQLVAFLRALTGDADDLAALLSRADRAPIGDIDRDDPHYAHRREAH